MSSFKNVVLEPIKRRVGFAVVIGLAALFAALFTGSSVIAAVAAIVVVVALGLVLERRRRSPSDGSPLPTHPPGGPYVASYRWRTDQEPNLVDVYQVLIHEGLVRNVASQAPGKVVLRGGSQWWTRIMGGYFINPKRLPIEVSLGTQDMAGGEEFIVELGIHDRLGIGIRDEALGERYAQAATGIRKAVGYQLNTLGGREIESDPPISE